MELEILYKSSTFLSKYEYLNNSYDVSKVDAQLILNHYKSNIKKYSNSSTTNFLNINTLKNELIYLIFISIHQNLISQSNGSRLWSVLCKNILSKIININLYRSFNNSLKKYYFILGMGKIGVRDLNFASDIDIIIFYDSKNSPISLQDFNKSIKKTISDISNISESFFHKIDLRLRPDFGDSLIISDMDQAINYYTSVGRNWERLAFHRSSFLCGDIQKYFSFKEAIKSFLFRRTFDYYAIDEIKKLFASSNTEQKLDIKNSYGFIRSCENIIHFNQLLWSGKINSLKESNIHKLLINLKKHENIIPKNDLKNITEAYYYFRKIENYLHIKKNTFQNIIDSNETYLNSVLDNFSNKLEKHKSEIQTIYQRLFFPKINRESLRREKFNESSQKIIDSLLKRAENINSSETVKNDYLESISSLINILSTHNKRDDLIIKFDYLINYYKSGVHLTALYKYNNKIFLELAFIFENSSKLTNLIYKNHFLIESLVYFFNYGIPTFKLREFSDNFDLDLKKSIQDIYEILFLLDYLLLSKKITNTDFLKKRNTAVRKFIFYIFELVKNEYIVNRSNIFSDLTPILFGSYGVKMATNFSDLDIFFIYQSNKNNHIDNIKIVRRFYSIMKQYIDPNILIIDDRNKPFDRDSDQVINIENFFSFYSKTSEPFHKLSFMKVCLLTNNLKLVKYFTKMKNQIISNFSKIDNEYFLKIVDIKNPLKNNKDLFQLFKIKEDINHINNKEFSYRDDINYLRELLMFENLTSNPSKVDNKKYLDRLLLI